MGRWIDWCTIVDCMYVCMHLCMCVCRPGCLYVCIYVCMYTGMAVCVYECAGGTELNDKTDNNKSTHPHIQLYIPTHTYIHTYMHAYIHTMPYTHTHIHSWPYAITRATGGTQRGGTVYWHWHTVRHTLGYTPHQITQPLRIMRCHTVLSHGCHTWYHMVLAHVPQNTAAHAQH